jgi:hypothetical protein
MAWLGSSAEKRVALIIGNSAYQNIDKLTNPQNDAHGLERALEELDFKVHSGLDLNKSAMKTKIQEFTNALTEERADVGLVYYSGHGLQVDGVNYCVPIDAQIASKEPLDQLVPLGDLIGAMGEGVKTRLVLLDACRNNPYTKGIVESVQQSKGIKNEGAGKEPPRGLAEIKAPPGTFIAFAAGPGDVAYEGWQGSEYSAFTDGLLKHIDSTDLSLDNLMIRVGNEVRRNTQDKQVTWGHSSLQSTFFFKPGSLILLIGNAIGLVALLVSLAPYSFAIADKESAICVSTGIGITLLTLALFLFGLQRAYALLRTGRGDDDEASNNPPEARFRIPWRRGLYGGFFGGLIAGPIITVAYNFAGKWNEQPLPHPTIGRMLTDITVGSTIVGLFLGILALSFAEYFSSIRRHGNLATWLARCFNPLTGGIVGGILAGIITGPTETLYYHSLPGRPHLYPSIMLVGALPGSAVVVFAIINYSLDRISLREFFRSGGIVILAMLVVAVVAALPLYVFDATINANIKERLATDEILNVLLAGLVYGILVGAILGAVIGLTLYWTRGGRRDTLSDAPLAL